MRKDTRTFLATVLGIPFALLLASGLHAANDWNTVSFGQDATLTTGWVEEEDIDESLDVADEVIETAPVAPAEPPPKKPTPDAIVPVTPASPPAPTPPAPTPAPVVKEPTVKKPVKKPARRTRAS